MPLFVTLALTLCALAASQPVLPLVVAPAGTWAAPGSAACQGHYCGDIRAVVQLTSSDIVGSSATVQVWWRRRDPTPYNKSVLVTDASGVGLTVSSAAIESDCGLITFTSPSLAPGLYYLYYLPFRQSSGGAGLAFSWVGCNDQSTGEGNPCVLGGSQGGSSVCSAVTPAASPVPRLENRDAFNAFSTMELLATASEAAATAAALAAAGAWAGVFPEDRDHAIRVLYPDTTTPGRPIIPARWSPGQGGPQATASPSLALSSPPGQWLAFQVGLWAYSAPIANLTFTATAFPPDIPQGALTIINLEGTDVNGAPLLNTAYSLPTGYVGALWCGLDIPASTQPGLHTGSLQLLSPGHPPITVALAVTVTAEPPLPLGGAANVSSLARLPWLNSARGLEDVVPVPFEAVTAAPVGGGGLAVTSLNKVLSIGVDGLPEQITVAYPRVRLGQPAPSSHSILSAPVAFTLHTAAPGTPAAGPATITSPAAIVNASASSVTWAATSSVPFPGSPAGLTLLTQCAYDFTSYLNVVVTVSNPAGAPAAVALGDIRLTVPQAAANLGWVVGMEDSGKEACEYEDRLWRWSNSTGANKLWWGRPEAGLLVNLKGDGEQWDSPMFGKDFPILPFIPDSWGGGGAAATPPPPSTPTGLNLTAGTAVAFSGPRTLAPGASITFRFDLAITPSKTQDWTRHWATRTRQLGYDVPYASPQAVAAMGVTVVTIHQGTPGIVNGSLINPYINYPFLPDTVPLLTNYTEQANALGVAVKYYYTVRELSARAPEMPAFYAMQGEVLVDMDPWTVVQPGYAHDWDTHGGSAPLHQHYVGHYGACWQQALSNGEWDPAMCSIGVSRLFNYYLEGLFWAFSQPPFINGIYYDGQNFPRSAMIRIRRAADAAAAASGKGFRPFLDLHTGREPTPDVCSYASHYPLIDYFWNGEGYDFSPASAPAYWLVETSLTVHGLTGDMLGSGARSVFKGMLSGMTQRDADSSQALWGMWDATRINETDALFSWWMADGQNAVNVTVAVSGAEAAAAPAPPNCTWQETIGSYYGSVNTPCLPADGPTPGCWASRHTLQAAQEACCSDAQCLGLSFNPSDGTGCCKANQDGPFHLKGEVGYVKSGGPPPPPCTTVLSTTWSKYASHAVVAVASWCRAPTNVTLSIDWEALGLNPATVVASLPGVAGVQAARQVSDARGPFEVAVDGGLIMLLQG